MSCCNKSLDANKTDVALNQMRPSYHNNIIWTKMMDVKCSFEHENIIFHLNFEVIK